MAQRPTADFNIDPNITSGTDLANILNRFQDAIDSGNSGASRPAYLDAGGLWVQTGNPMRLFLYDGTKDNELFNTTDGIIGININDGTEVGQVTTWNGSSWTGDSSLVISGGDATFSGGVDLYGLFRANKGANEFTANSVSAGVQLGAYDRPNTQYTQMHFRADNYRFSTAGLSNTAFSIKADTSASFFGNVGIGMDPLRSTAKEQLEEWQSRFDAQIEADPKADKKALTLEITDNAFDALPTEAELAEWMEGRAAGDALQVIGNGSFSGTVTANQFVDANGPIISAFTMVEAFRKIKNAVADETTVEGIKESLTNVLGGLIEEFESIGTQES